jgi:hypothetical protein
MAIIENNKRQRLWRRKLSILYINLAKANGVAAVIINSESGVAASG